MRRLRCSRRPRLGQQSPTENATAKQAAEDAKPKKKPQAEPPPPAPDVVRVGGLINDIQQLDLQSHSYNVDMYIWFKWKNPDINPAQELRVPERVRALGAHPHHRVQLAR